MLAALISIAALLAAASTLISGAVPARAANGERSNGPAKPSSRPNPTPALSPRPTPICGAGFNPDLCPSPTTSEVVVSPVAPDPPATPPTASYLVGTAPSPTPARVGNSGSSPVPLGGGFVDQVPTPSQQATSAPASDLVPRQSGLPLAFVAVGALLILGALGSLIYAVAPRQKNVFVRDRPPGRSPVLLTPHGPDAPSSNVLSSGQTPRPPQRPA
jgi:hypothetical protein